MRLLEHARELDLETFENPIFQDKLERARTQISSQLAVLMSLAQLMQTATGVVTMVAAVAIYAPWLVVIQAIAVLPVAWAETHYASVAHRLYQRRTALRRTMEYLLFLGTTPSTVKEVKAFGLGGHLVEEYGTIGTQFIAEDTGVSRKRNVTSGVLTMLGTPRLLRRILVPRMEGGTSMDHHRHAHFSKFCVSKSQRSDARTLLDAVADLEPGDVLERCLRILRDAPAR